VSALYDKSANALAPGHRACIGCGEALGVRVALNAAGKNIIVANATGCIEIFTSAYPDSAWNVSWIHSLFENAAAVGAGIEAGLKALGRTDTRVVAQAGDGGTADIGLQCLSGMMERGHDVLYFCYDNEAYMNTGVQRSGLTPTDARTTTSPPGSESWGNQRPKKDMPAICAAHHIPYVATASVGYIKDLERKVAKAMSLTGPKYIQIHVPCPLGWAFDSAKTIKLAQLAVNSGLYPLIEMEWGKLTAVRKIGKIAPVEDYLKPQGRFRHLFRDEAGAVQLARVQEVANENIARYGLAAS
jgi:pyruvate ferredoxin oxidoreductase beta subunit